MSKTSTAEAPPSVDQAPSEPHAPTTASTATSTAKTRDKPGVHVSREHGAACFTSRSRDRFSVPFTVFIVLTLIGYFATVLAVDFPWGIKVAALVIASLFGFGVGSGFFNETKVTATDQRLHIQRGPVQITGRNVTLSTSNIRGVEILKVNAGAGGGAGKHFRYGLQVILDDKSRVFLFDVRDEEEGEDIKRRLQLELFGAPVPAATSPADEVG